MAVDGARETVTGGADASDDRPSRVVEIVEREAKPVAGAVEAGRGRDEDFEIETDLEAGGARNESTATVEAVRASGERRDAIVPKDTGAPALAAKPSEVEEEAVIEVSDEEISSADDVARASRPSISPESSLQRSRPPARPSLRPRPPIASSSLPPPSRASLPAPFGPGGSYPPGSLPAITEDPWQRANKALELSRALARIAELEELVAYREARMVTLQEKLDAAERKLAELGHGPISVRNAPAAASPRVASPAATSARASSPAATSARASSPAATSARASSPVASAAPSRAPAPPAAASSAPATSASRRSVPMPADRDRGVPREPQQPSRAPGSSPNNAKPAANAKEITQTKMAVATPRAANANTAAPAVASATARADQPAAAPAPARTVEVAAKPPAVAAVAPAAVAPVGEPATSAPVVRAVSAVSAPAEVPARPEPAPKPATPAAAPVASASTESAEDDLRLIAGIGPRFEAALRKQGITRLSQIAAWSDADVKQVAKALKIPKSRIVKGRWVESAREAIGSRGASE